MSGKSFNDEKQTHRLELRCGIYNVILPLKASLNARSYGFVGTMYRDALCGNDWLPKQNIQHNIIQKLLCYVLSIL